MLLRLTGELTVNTALSSELSIDTRYYMNGSRSFLLIRMRDGGEIRLEHGFGVDIWALKEKIEAAEGTMS